MKTNTNNSIIQLSNTLKRKSDYHVSLKGNDEFNMSLPPKRQFTSWTYNEEFQRRDKNWIYAVPEEKTISDASNKAIYYFKTDNYLQLANEYLKQAFHIAHNNCKTTHADDLYFNNTIANLSQNQGLAIIKEKPELQYQIAKNLLESNNNQLLELLYEYRILDTNLEPSLNIPSTALSLLESAKRQGKHTLASEYLSILAHASKLSDNDAAHYIQSNNISFEALNKLKNMW